MPIDWLARLRPRRAILGIVALAAAIAGLVAAESGPAGENLSLRMAFVRASTDLAQRFEPDNADTAARVTLGPGGRDLRVAGDLMEGVSARVASLLAAHPEVRRIHLTSDGGLVEEGLALGGLVADHGLATYVPDDCASACTLAFVRGSQRYLGTGGRLGFHAPYEAGLFGQAFAVDSGPERAAYRAAGIAADFTAEALAVSSDDIWIPDAARLLQAGVVTEIVETDRFPDSTLDDDASPQAARAQVLRNLPILAEADPAAVDKLAAWYRGGYVEGRSEADALEGLQQQAAAHFRHLFRMADDATIRALGHAALTAMRQAEGEDRSACEAIAGGDVVVIEATLRRARHPVPSVAALIAQARRMGETGAAAEIAASDAAKPRRFARRGPGRCGARIEAVRRALDRPVQEAAFALRRLLLDDVPEVVGVADP
ncbi:hypothetical protein [uncultured Methylobacterium sp.]|uniref:hypothetical protein n=1 Tax=uncultured Methylobacterium sp. TaxID=157278 RepID=UPI0035CC5C5B